MAERKTHEQPPEDPQRAQRGEKHGAESGLSGGEATTGQSAQVRPGGSAPGGQTPGQAQAEHGSQGLAGAQGSGGGAERGMTQDPDQRRRTSGSGGT